MSRDDCGNDVWDQVYADKWDMSDADLPDAGFLFVRPIAIRATSGHSNHENMVPLDPTKLSFPLTSMRLRSGISRPSLRMALSLEVMEEEDW